MKNFLPFAFVILFFSCKNDNAADTGNEPITNTIAPPANISYNIVASYPHDTASYTQGLIWKDNFLYEGTGLEGQSRLMKVDLKNGKASQKISLDTSLFGEGITILNGKIYQLTWQNHKVFVYEEQSLKKLKEFSWEHDGWGITHNGIELIISTGESNLYFVDPETFKIKRIIGVSDQNGPTGNLNELEYIDGAIYANIYLTDYIVKIDPSSGHILGKMDLSHLLEKSGKHVSDEGNLVLNGIAYDSTKKSMYITGKKWPLLYELKLL
ncbi:MAG TPA: glutaminyl-peptide cyclotransferase [Segetibacter sp.]